MSFESFFGVDLCDDDDLDLDLERVEERESRPGLERSALLRVR